MPNATCTAHYPPAVFEMDFVHGYAYERFVHNAFRIGRRVVRERGLPDQISIDFDRTPAWQPLVGIRAERWQEQTTGFNISASAFTPVFAFSLCHFFGEDLFDPPTRDSWLDDPILFRSQFSVFVGAVRAAIAEFKRSGLERATKTLYDDCNLSLVTMQRSVNTFDNFSKFIVNHELAHAFVGQLTHTGRTLTAADNRGFEIVVDLLATEWLYNKSIRSIPDSEEYRSANGFENHPDAVLVNSELALRSQIMFLLFVFLAKGELGGGSSPPHSMIRHLVQNMHLMTLIESNQLNQLGRDGIEYLDITRESVIQLLFKVNAISDADLRSYTNATLMADIQHAGALIDEFQIPVVGKLSGLLARVSAMGTREEGDHLG